MQMCKKWVRLLLLRLIEYFKTYLAIIKILLKCLLYPEAYKKTKSRRWVLKKFRLLLYSSMFVKLCTQVGLQDFCIFL